MKQRWFVSILILLGACIQPVFATSNYDYKPGEYVTITGGTSPDGRYLIATHGDGELGYENWHIYLMDAISGKRIGPLEEIRDPLDTAADGYVAKWSPDSSRVAITYRADRHVAVTIVYRIANRRAYLLSGPTRIPE
jgi:dipeptidyl aminopeptidase/acylaminoacyl peptidase